MSEMVERVAKALFLDRYPESEEYWPDRVGICELGSADDYRGYARAAIEAMREPTERMLEVGDHGTSRQGWGYMIDEALK